MYKYLDDFPLYHDENYQQIINILKVFVESLPSNADKELFVRMAKEIYLKHNRSIRAKGENDTEILIATLVALLLEQTKQIERLEMVRKQ